MRISTTIDCLQALIPLGQPVFLSGPPGVGKSAAVRAAADNLYAAEYGLTPEAGGRLRGADGKYTNQRPYLIDIRAVLIDPVDLRGLPIVKGGRAEWAPPSFLPLEGTPRGDKPGVIFVDELPQAAQLVQSAFLQGILDYAIGEARISRKWAWVAAGNRAEDRSGSYRVITNLANRFMHLDMEAHIDDWQAWAVQSGIKPEVRGFLNFRPTALHKFDPTSNAKAFASPRSWEFVSTILPACTDETMFDLVRGCVGEGHAAEFVAFAKVYRALPDVDGILANPAAGKVPDQPDVLYAVSTAIVEKVRNDGKKAAAALKYTGRMPDEFAVLTFRDLLKVNQQLLATPEGRDLLKKYRDKLLGV